MGWGGKRPGAGKKPGTKQGPSRRAFLRFPPGTDMGEEGRRFAGRVLLAIKDGPPKDQPKTPEEYALLLLFSQDPQARSYNFNRLLDRLYGKPVQQMRVGDPKGEKLELGSGNALERIDALLARAVRADKGFKPN